MYYVEKKDMLIIKISVPGTITLEKPHLFKPSLIDEIDILITSDFDDITFSYYMTQPKSMIQKKLIKNFIEEDW